MKTKLLQVLWFILPLDIACYRRVNSERAQLSAEYQEIGRKVTLTSNSGLSEKLSFQSILRDLAPQRFEHLMDDIAEACWISQGLAAENRSVESAGAVSMLHGFGVSDRNPLGSSPRKLRQIMDDGTFEFLGIAPRFSHNHALLRVIYDFGEKTHDEHSFDIGLGMSFAFTFIIGAADRQAFLDDVDKLDGGNDKAIGLVQKWMVRSDTQLLRTACATEKSSRVGDWVWFELKLDKNKEKFDFEDILVPRVKGGVISLGIVSYRKRDDQLIVDRPLTVAHEEAEAMSCSQCHTRNTAFHSWDERNQSTKELQALAIETPFVHLSRSFGKNGPRTHKSRFQIGFEKYQLRLFHLLKERGFQSRRFPVIFSH
ncbi:hypothetical protein [Oligoflexus tunisiensis]|uniref:hypothetical protein n=1 Tax=Oligoflexus tunisiensis TaxID=708132 RepID=UPI00114C9CEA|nr:hypothetical protein [Oligoflexus tunisiensis]